jgi:hypothetical protein
MLFRWLKTDRVTNAHILKIEYILDASISANFTIDSFTLINYKPELSTTKNQLQVK